MLITGDWNETPDLSHVGFQIDCPRDGLGSRWQQKKPRIIDYVACNYGAVQDLTARPEKWADHRAMSFSGPLFGKMNGDLFEVVPCNTYLPSLCVLALASGCSVECT